MIWVFIATFALLCIAGLLVLIRLILGTTMIDRILAVDVFVILVVAATAVGMAFDRDGSNMALVLGFALLAFVGIVSASRLVERKEPYR